MTKPWVLTLQIKFTADHVEARQRANMLGQVVGGFADGPVAMNLKTQCPACRGTCELSEDIECHHCTGGTMTVAEVAEYERHQRECADLGGF